MEIADDMTRTNGINDSVRHTQGASPLDDTEYTMGDDNTNQKKRKAKWITSYSNMTMAQAEQRLGFRIRSLKGIPVQRMLAIANQGESPDDILTTKEKVYGRILEYLQIEGYPTEADPDFKESNINHLVYATITPIISDFIHQTGRVTVQLRSEKRACMEEFAVLDLISVKEERFILIVEAKRSSLGQAMKQCLLAMKDMRDSNGEGKVYGFVTTGEQWQMLEYDGTSFRKTNIMIVVFDSMDDEKEKWLKENSILVDCIKFALNNGGIVKNLFLRSSRSNTDPLIYTDTMGDDSTNQKKRKPKWVTSYSSMSLEDAEDRLGLRIATLELQAISVAKMLAEAKYKQDAGDAILNNTRERVYDRILDHLVAEGYPSESDPYFNEVNTSDLVYATIVPIIVDFSINRRNTIQLQRERQIIATDSATGGYEEFVVVDWISMREAKFVFVIEAKRSSLGQAMKQCLLAMKDMKDSNGGGMVYGFTTTGDLWRMVTYDGELFKMTEQFFAVFPGMRVEKERWMKDYSALVDCMYVALSNGGID